MYQYLACLSSDAQIHKLKRLVNEYSNSEDSGKEHMCFGHVYLAAGLHLLTVCSHKAPQSHSDVAGRVKQDTKSEC